MKFKKEYSENISKEELAKQKLYNRFGAVFKFLIIGIFFFISLKYFIINLNLEALLFSDYSITLIIDQVIVLFEILIFVTFNSFLISYLKINTDLSRNIKIVSITIANLISFLGFFLLNNFIFFQNISGYELLENFTLNLINFFNNINYLIYFINYNIILFTSCFIFAYFIIKNIKVRIFLSLLVNFIFFYFILNQFSLFEMFDFNVYVFSFIGLGINILLFIINLRHSQLTYKIKEYKIDESLIQFQGYNKNKILSILEIEEIPKNLKVRETRELPRIIEKLNIKYIKQYVFFHLLTLAEELEQIAYEIVIKANSIKLRFILTVSGKQSLSNLKETMKNKTDFFESVYISCFPGLKFKILKNNDLLEAWKEIIFFSDKKIKVIDKTIIETSDFTKKTKDYFSFLKIDSPISIKPQDSITQIDQLINNMLSNKIQSHFVTVIKPYIKYDFDEKYNKFGPGFLKNQSLLNGSDVDLRNKVKKLSQYLRHKESLQLWKCSVYQVINSKNINDLKTKMRKSKAFLKTIFSDSFKKIDIESIKQINFNTILAKTLMREPLNELIVSSDQIIGTFHLPEKVTPSLVTNFKIPNFDIPPKIEFNQNKIPIGEVLYQDLPLFPAYIDIEELRLNIFITGLIGMGKTEASKNILINLSKSYPNVNWMVLEWKGDYNNLIHQIDEPVLVLPIGNENLNIKINLFEPRKSNPENHANKIFSIFKESLKSSLKREMNSYELSPQMEKVTKEILVKCVKNREKRNFKSFFEELTIYEKENTINNRSVSMTVAAIENRFRKFINGSLRNILDVEKSNVNFEDLMQYKVIFDFSHLILKEGSKEDAILLMNIILKYVMDEALNRGPVDELKHLVVIEDAQYLVPSVLRELPESTLGEDIPLLLRGVGESMISIATRPEISQDIIANSAIKISFRLTSGQDTSKISSFQNLNELQEKYLKILPKRECIASTLNFPFPFRIKVFNNQEKKTSSAEIFSYNYKNFLNFNFFKSEKAPKELEITKTDIIPYENSKLQTNYNKVIESINKQPKSFDEIKANLKIDSIEINSIIQELTEKNQIQMEIFPIFESNMGRYFIKYFKNDDLSLKNQIKNKIIYDFQDKNNILSNGKYLDFSLKGQIGVKIIEIKSPEKRNSIINKEISQLVSFINENKYQKIIIILPLYEDLIKFNEYLPKTKKVDVYSFYYNYKQWTILKKLFENLN